MKNIASIAKRNRSAASAGEKHQLSAPGAAPKTAAAISRRQPYRVKTAAKRHGSVWRLHITALARQSADIAVCSNILWRESAGEAYSEIFSMTGWPPAITVKKYRRRNLMSFNLPSY